MKYIFIMTVLCLATLADCYAQGYIEMSYTPNRNFTDADGEKLGKANQVQVKGRYSFPIYSRKNKDGQSVAWSATVNGMYARMNNSGTAAEINPEELVNANLNVTHLRPLSRNWYLLASVGVGIYAEPDIISMQSVLANGAVIFVYKLRENLHVGVGAGLTNSYGVPLVMPMGFLRWNTSGCYEFNAEMANSLKLSVARQFTSSFRMTLVPIEMDGISAVLKNADGDKIYGNTTMKAYLRPEWTWSKGGSVYLDIGGTLLSTVRLSNRSFKGFFDTFGNDDNKYRFGIAPRIVGGIKFRF